MAADPTTLPVNGNHHAQPGVDPNASLHIGSASSSGAVNGDSSTAVAATPAPAAATGASASSEGNSTVPKGEVGWYFVEQYYTTMSKSPEKLYLFYNKRSQFVSGVEEQKIPVSVGQRAINDRIKELDYQDCKVRVNNVDSQESFKNIVVQVIGEMSNKSAPIQKFVQTFVLAEQPNGYFVLNDIFRFIKDEEVIEEEIAEAEPAELAVPEEEEPKTLTSSDEPEAQEHDAHQLDEKLEEEMVHSEEKETPDETALPNGLTTTEQSEPAEAEPEAVVESAEPQEVTPEPEAVPEEPAAVPAEKPRDPDPTPVASPPKQAPAVPAQAPTPAAPPKPAAPKTWANMVAANRVAPIPAAVPIATTSPAAAPTQPKATPQPAPLSHPAPSAVTEDAQNTVPPSPGAGWQTAGQENPKRQGRQQSVSGFEQKANISGYVKNVTDRVDASILRQTLSSFGKLDYFDNCAFVEFATLEGYQAAVNANPHVIGGEQIYVEERRPRPNAYGGGYGGRGGMRGGRGGPDGARGGGQGRGGYKDGGRGGGFPRGGRGGTGNVTPRGGGRGQPLAT